MPHIVKVIVLFLISYFLLLNYNNNPVLILVILTYLVIFYIISLLKTKYSLLLLLFPLIHYLISISFNGFNFMELGDGPLYRRHIVAIFSLYNKEQNTWDYILDLLFREHNVKYLQLGASISQLFADYNFGRSVTPQVYHLSQVLVYSILISLLALLARLWNTLKSVELNILIIGAMLWPPLINYISMLTRHHVTFFAVCLYFLAMDALWKKITFFRIIIFLLAIVLIVFSKVGILPFALLSSFIIYILPSLETKLRKLFVFIVFGIIIFGIQIVNLTGLYKADLIYDDPSTFNIITEKLGVLAAPYKYLMAILSPFPWYKIKEQMYSLAFGGNLLSYSLHVVGAILSLHLMLTILINIKDIFNVQNTNKYKIVIFGIIMSLSIIGGSTGFNVYLLIYYPFMLVYCFYAKRHMSITISLSIVILLNFVMLIVT